MDWQRGRLLRSCVLVLSTMQNYVSIMRLLCFLAKVSHTTCILFATLDTMYRYNVIWLFKVTLVLMWVFFLKKKQLCFCFKKSFIVLSFAFFFPLCMSIASCCHVLLVCLWFLVLLVPSMLVFWSVSGQVFFWFSMPFDNRVKKGRNLIFECHSSRGVINLGGELDVKGKKFFWCN